MEIAWKSNSSPIEFVAQGPVEGEALSAVAVPVFEGPVLTAAGEALDAATEGAVSRAIGSGRFTGAKGQVLDLIAPAGLHAARLVLVGGGAREALDDLALEGIAAGAYHAVKTTGVSTLELRLGDFTGEQAARAAFGARLAGYRFDRYLTRQKPEKKPSVLTVKVASDEPEAASTAFDPLSAVADAILFARDLVSEPANILYPAEFARRVKQLEELGLEVEILGEAEMAELGMGSLLGVGQGSVRESQLAVIQWKGAADPDAPPVAFVGKGVCFDTGGISIKPAEGMEEMKTDMGGAAAVTGVMHALAGRKAKVNAVGILGLVENMPGGEAIRPGDILTSMSGQTIEVINTDAEGPPRPGRRALVLPRPLQAPVHDRPGDPDRGHDRRPGQRPGGPVRQRRGPGRGHPRRRQGRGRAPVAHAAARRLRQDDRHRGGGHEEHRRARRRLDHRRPVPAAVRQGRPLGPPRHRAGGLAQVVDQPDGAGGRLRLWRAAAEPAGGRPLRGQAGLMACEVWFYHLERTGLDQALPDLLQKTLAKGWRVLVRSADKDRIDYLDGWLWSWRDDSFLPHGLAEEPQAERQPVLLTTTADNANAAQALFLLDDADPGELGAYERCVVMFDGGDEALVGAARRRWKALKGAGHRSATGSRPPRAAGRSRPRVSIHTAHPREGGDPGFFRFLAGDVKAAQIQRPKNAWVPAFAGRSGYEGRLSPLNRLGLNRVQTQDLAFGAIG